MIAFLRDMADNPFLLNGLLAGVLAAVACGVVGPYVVARRMVFLVGAVAHVAVGGVGAAIYLNRTMPSQFGWLTPMHGAFAAAIIAAVLIAILLEYARERLDTLIGACWAVGMSGGIMLMKFTPGYQSELTSFLFGNLAYVPADALWMLAALNGIIIVTVALMHKRMLAVSLDETFARVQGVRVFTINLILLLLIALATIALVRVVGLILVLALLTLPAATVGHFTRRFDILTWGSILLCALLTTIPRMAVYGTRVSPESSIVLVAAFIYLAVVIAHWRPRHRQRDA